ncbi:hypothetical protein D3C78_1967170 [compost metagenome]
MNDLVLSQLNHIDHMTYSLMKIRMLSPAWKKIINKMILGELYAGQPFNRNAVQLR